MTARLVALALLMSLALGAGACASGVPSTATPTPAPTLTASPGHTSSATRTPGPTVTPREGQSLPAVPTPRVTATAPLVALPSASPGMPGGTSVFPLPTAWPEQTATPAIDCQTVYPLDAVQRIVGEAATLDQASAAFGPVLGVSGRPPRFRFEDRGCRLWIVAGPRAVQSAELAPYFSLDELLARYGDPAAVAEVPGALQLPGRERLALLYPAEGLIALFEHPPASRADLIPTLRVIPPTDLDGMVNTLGGGARLTTDWEPPLH